MAQKLAAKPNYDRCTILDEDLIAVYFNKSVCLGMSILELSKSLMYDFHYHYIKTKCGDKAKLLFTDSDSLAYETKTSRRSNVHRTDGKLWEKLKDLSRDGSKFSDNLNNINNFDNRNASVALNVFAYEDHVYPLQINNNERDEAANLLLIFPHHCRSMRVPFIIYADFQSFTPQLSSTSQPNPESSWTKQYQLHTPSEFCYHIKCLDVTLFSQDPATFVKESEDDDDVAQIFINTLEHQDIY